MNWIRNNKFLTIFFAVLLAGVGVLGYLLYTASGSYAEVSDTYNRDASELKRLQTLAPYPNQANLEKLRAEKEAYSASLASLQQTLNTMEFPVVPMSPEQFQDKLRDSVSKMMEKAKAAGVKMPEKFYLGFDVYQTSLPKPAAAAPLGRQLQAIEFVLNQLLDAKVDAIVSLARGNIVEEGTGTPASGRGGGPRGGAAPPSARKLVNAVPIQVSFVLEQNRFRKWLDEISTAKPQFFVVRLLAVKNENPKGPSRIVDATAQGEGPATAGVAPQPGSGTAATPPAGSSLKFIVGLEKVAVSARIDVIDFTAPTTK